MEARKCHCTKFLPSFCPYHYQSVCRQRWLSAWDQQSTKMHLTHSVIRQAREQADLTYPEYIQILDYKLHNWAGSFWNEQFKDVNISELSGCQTESMTFVKTICELNKLAASVNTIHFWSSQNMACKVHKVFTSNYIQMAYLTFTYRSCSLFFISDYISLAADNCTSNRLLKWLFGSSLLTS